MTSPLLDFAKAPFVMGILNVTPDSFSGDGLMGGLTIDGDFVGAAVRQAQRMHQDGAHILDIGGESTRPGATPVSEDEEVRRVLPVIEAIRNALTDIPIAVDTMKAGVADRAIRAGASIINDITAMEHDPAMGDVAAKHGCYLVLMHNRSNSLDVILDNKIGGQFKAPAYTDIVADVRCTLNQYAAIAETAGVARDKIILDPGIGFGKTVEQNLALINNIKQLKNCGYPLMIGTSRKSFIGRVLDSDVEGRLEGTAATVAASVLHGADIVRVHDVKYMARLVAMTAAIMKT